jgi:hydroxymethylpyrimidine pyrophosphatase-like HAD family hydrolase
LQKLIKKGQIVIIAVDFDGTIVEDRYPDIGKEKRFAFMTLKSLQKEGHRLILWTYRSGKSLEEAIEFCRKNGVEFYAINCSYPDEKLDETRMSRKIYADVFIDDRNIGGMIEWGEAWQIINGEISTEKTPKKKRKWF